MEWMCSRGWLQAAAHARRRGIRSVGTLLRFWCCVDAGSVVRLRGLALTALQGEGQASSSCGVDAARVARMWMVQWVGARGVAHV